jgi:hypothetical protein
VQVQLMTTDDSKMVDSNVSAATPASTTPSQAINEHATPPSASKISDSSGSAERSISNKSLFQTLSLPNVPDSSSVMASMDSAAPHLKDGLLNCVVGASLGGAVGVLLFKSGKGYRAASVAAGVGVAVGSTLERLSFEWQQSKKSD